MLRNLWKRNFSLRSKMSKKPLNLPEDCEKLSISACESFKTKDPKTGAKKCKIQYGKLGFVNKCKANEDYELEKFIFSKGFEEFTRIGEENMEKELRLRNKICQNLDPSSSCENSLGKKLGCKVQRKLLSPNSCRLDPKLVRFLKKRELLCEKEDCAELKKKGVICKKCTDELDEMLREHESLFDELVRKKNPPPDDVKRFFDITDQLKNEWYPYFVTGQKNVLDVIEKRKLKIEEIHGGVRCQAYNITGCFGSGENSKPCKCKGFKDRLGIFCGTHRNCYKDRVQKFNDFRDNFDRLCEEKGLCAPLVRKMKEFQTMIRHTTSGEASRKKIEVDNIIEYAEEYMKYT